MMLGPTFFYSCIILCYLPKPMKPYVKRHFLSLSWQAKTAKKCFASPDGDHFTLINVYCVADELLQKRGMELGTEKNEKNIRFSIFIPYILF